MAGWIERATAVFGRTEPLPQPFDIVCDCGVRVSGLRADLPQKPSCPSCGTTLFVLPSCVYPVPASLRRRWTGTEEVEPPPLPQRTKKSKAKPSKTNESSRPQAVESEPSPTYEERARQLGARLKAAATPVRLVAAAILCALLLTGGVIYRKARWNHAQTVLQGAIDRGTAALDDRDFPIAAAEFRDAVAALDVLGRDDESARGVRRTARETAAAANLLESPLPDVIGQWASSKPAASASWTPPGNPWILFDAWLYPEPHDPQQSSRRSLLLDLPLLVDGLPVQVVVEGDGLASYVAGATAAEPRRMIFAAQLDRIERRKGSGSASARVWLNDVTLVVWSDPATYEALGLMPDDVPAREAVEQILTDQREFLETRQ